MGGLARPSISRQPPPVFESSIYKIRLNKGTKYARVLPEPVSEQSTVSFNSDIEIKLRDCIHVGTEMFILARLVLRDGCRSYSKNFWFEKRLSTCGTERFEFVLTKGGRVTFTGADAAWGIDFVLLAFFGRYKILDIRRNIATSQKILNTTFHINIH
jgi:hypothetical protein